MTTHCVASAPDSTGVSLGDIPSIEMLEKYSAVLLYSHNSFFALEDKLGDVMAEYVDRGDIIRAKR